MSAARLKMFEGWLEGELLPGAPFFIYHRGELARDRAHDPDLAALADRALTASDGKFDVVSKCGHVRGRIVGSGQVRLVTRKERGETAYMAVKR